MENKATDDVLTPLRIEKEVIEEETLRPRNLDEFTGQSQIKENLRVFMEAAKQRGEALDHMLLYGPPGLGKTTLAHIAANELGVDIKSTSGPAGFFFFFSRTLSKYSFSHEVADGI